MSLSLIILLPLLGAVVNGSFALASAVSKKSVPRSWVNVFGVGLPFVAFGVALKLGLPLIQGVEMPFLQPVFSWITVGHLAISANLVYDHLSVLMTLIITGVGSLIHLYSTGYMKDDPAYARYFAYLNLFLASMLILVLADNLLFLFVGWEGVGLCSYLLIGFWFEDPQKAYAGKKAFVVNRIGDFGFLVGIFIVMATLLPQTSVPAPVLGFDYMKLHIHLLIPLAPAIAAFLFVGAMGKSAQIPLYVWLPDAMAGPTPVSALIHAATMVTAGIYMIARMSFLYSMAPQTLEWVAGIGAATALFAALIGLVQNDIKKVLAYSTVSQLGYMFLGVGVGAYSAGVFHLMTHAFFKACLFLGSGSVIHAMSGEQDIQKMGALRKAMPITAFTFLLATLAIAGIPPFAGFFSKDEILWQAYHSGHVTLWVLGLLAAGCTSFYMFRLFALTFLGKSRVSEKAAHHLHESPWTMTSVLVILGLLSLVGGWVGIPIALHGQNHFHHWLGLGEEVIENADAIRMEQILAVGSALWAALMGAFALVIYLRFPEAPKAWARKASGLYRLLLNKFYVDEIYQAVIVTPVREFSQKFLADTVDQRVIDGALVNGSGRLVSWIGSCVSYFQGGLANSYAFYFLIALAGFVLFSVIF